MSTYLASVPILLAVAGAIAAVTARMLRTETALAAGEIVALATLADDAALVRLDADALAARTRATRRPASRPGSVGHRAHR